MPILFTRFAAALTLSLCLTPVQPPADSRLSRQDAVRCQAKLAQIATNAVRPAARGPHSTLLSDAELNAYLKFLAGGDIPVGIVDPVLSAQGGGHVAGRAIVDLDAVRTQQKRAWTDPMAYLTGRLPVTVSGTLMTANGVGRFQLASAEISGVTVPKALLQELLSYYSATPSRPSGLDMDAPFQLPAAIREIRVNAGSVQIVQ
jgi:hypothetical protein